MAGAKDRADLRAWLQIGSRQKRGNGVVDNGDGLDLQASPRKSFS